MPPCSWTVSAAILVERVGAVRLRDVRELLGVRRRPVDRAYDAAHDAERRHLDQHQHVGHPVLERLERADRPAELHPLLAVGDRHLERPGRQAGRERGDADGADQLGAGASGRGRRRSASPPPTSSRRRKPDGLVHRRQPVRVTRRRIELDQAVVGGRDAGRWPGRRRATGLARRRRTRRPRRPRSGAAAAAWRRRSAPASSASAVTSEDEQGRGRERPADLLEHDHRLEAARTPAPSYSSGIASAATPICSQSVCQSASS